MSKKGNTRRKNEQRKRLRRAEALAARGSVPRGPSREDILDRADHLIHRREWSEARAILERYNEDHPDHPDVLWRLMGVYQEERDFASLCRVCRKLLDRSPRDPDVLLTLAGGYLADARMTTALQTFRRFLRLWPDHPFAEGARDMVATLGPAVDGLLAGFPFPEEEKHALGVLHEEILSCLSASDDARVVALAEQLLARCPRFTPAMNNLGEAYFRTGRANQAIATARQVLEVSPDNFHALANLARYLFLTGHEVEARDFGRRLRAARSDNHEIWAKKAETFSFLGDDDAVIESFEEAKRAGYTKTKDPGAALLSHLGAVAHARRGDAARAQRLWRRAKKAYPGLALIDQNLEDARKPPAERHRPWPFSMNYWLGREVAEELGAALADPVQREDEESIDRAMRRFAKRRPEVAALVPALLDRGDDVGREIAWRFAMLVETPELVDALRVFCLSQRGPDAMRIETASYLRQKVALPSETVRMWIRGRWQEVGVLGFEITDEPTISSHSPEVDAWAGDAIRALHRDDGRRAEELLQKCLKAAGDHPDLLNNLAMSYELQDRHDEAVRLIRQVHQRWPDYFFGRVAMAQDAMGAENYDAAEAYLAPLRQRSRLHLTEFTALCVAHVRLALGCRDFQTAERWAEMGKDIAPEHPEIARLESCIAIEKIAGRPPKWLARARRQK